MEMLCTWQLGGPEINQANEPAGVPLWMTEVLEMIPVPMWEQDTHKTHSNTKDSASTSPPQEAITGVVDVIHLEHLMLLHVTHGLQSVHEAKVEIWKGDIVHVLHGGAERPGQRPAKQNRRPKSKGS